MFLFSVLSVIPAFLNVIVVSFMVNPKNQFGEKISLSKQLTKSISLFFKKKKLRNYAILSILNGALANSIFRFDAAYDKGRIRSFCVQIRGVL